MKCRVCGVPTPVLRLLGRVLGSGLCEGCQETQKASEARQRLNLARESALQRWTEMCPNEYASTDLHRIPSAAAFQRVQGWEFGPRGLLVVGPRRLGKTRAMMTRIERLVVGELLDVRIFLAGAFSHEVSERFGQPDGPEWMRGVMGADVVFLDDLGKFRLTERVEAELFGLIEHRTSWQLPMLLTMNAGVQELQQRMSAERALPLIERLREFCEIVSF